MTKEALAQPNFCPRCGRRLGANDWDIHTCTPPQRTWVGLTDEEIMQVMEIGLGVRDSIETALDKLKEKNT